MLSSPKVSESSPHPGSKRLTALDGGWLSHNGNLLSAYYHPSNKHAATTVGSLGEKKSTEDAGKWAVSIQTRGLMLIRLFTIHFIDLCGDVSSKVW